MMYDEGNGIERDQSQAVRWFRAAAEQGHAIAQFNLGSMYENGEGVEADGAEALYWYQAAGNQGSYEGCMAAAEMYEKGDSGVPLDNAYAYAWYSVAVKHAGSEEEKQLADEACYRAISKTTPDQIAGLAKAAKK